MNNMQHVFCVDNMAEDLRRVGYSESAIAESVLRWSLYNYAPVVFDIDSENGHIKNTQIQVHIKWCIREGK